MITLEKLKKIVSLEGIAELNPDARYLVKVPKGISPEGIDYFRKTLDAHGVKAIVVTNDIEFYEMKR